MSWDRERYRLEVLEPARRSGNMPEDVYVRYGLRDDLSDPGACTAQVADVLVYWRELESRGRYQRLARDLIAAHSRLEREGPLTLQAFSSHRERARQERAQRLAQMAEAEARSATHAGPATVTRLHETLAVPEAEVAAALSQAGVRIVAAFPELGGDLHPKQADLAQNVHQLGLRLSVEVLFDSAALRGFRVLGGFRLANGRGVDEAAFRDARDRTAALPHTNPARAPTENVLAILGAAARRPGDLDELLLCEVAESLRPFARSRFPQLTIAQQARELGLDEDEAGVLAGALLAEEPPRRKEDLGRQAVEALDAGRLRSAQRLAEGLPSADPVAKRIAAQDAKVAALSRQADEELARGRREQAAVMLADALEMASDDPVLADRLIALPPPAPRDATATVDGQHILVTWESRPLLAGRLRFWVRRGQGSAPASPEAGAPVTGESTRYRAVDESAPPGTDLRYSVFACYGVLGDRVADACSEPAVTPLVVLVPDVTSIRLVPQATSVTASWQPPPGPYAVRVRRGVGAPPRGADGGTPVEASLSGFTDTGLQTGTEYIYRITVSHRAGDGRLRYSPGVLVPAVPAFEPEPITDLTVAVTVTGDRSSSAVASWTPPPHGEVRLVACDAPPRWKAGHHLTPQGLAGLRDLGGVPSRREDGRDCLELSLPSGRHYLVPLTVTGNSVVAGNVAEAELVEPVRDVTADRMDDCVRLAWEWPDGATDAMIRWPGGEHRCSKRVYKDEGGVTVTVGPAETLIEVRALYPHRDDPLTAPAATCAVPARRIAVRYRLHRTGMFRRRRRMVQFLPEVAVQMPVILVVRSDGRHPPDDPAEGTTLLRIEPQPVTPERGARVTVDVPKGPGWLACFTEPARTEILLFPPPVEEMRLR